MVIAISGGPKLTPAFDQDHTVPGTSWYEIGPCMTGPQRLVPLQVFARIQPFTSSGAHFGPGFPGAAGLHATEWQLESLDPKTRGID
jgi:hypothetical protein